MNNYDVLILGGGPVGMYGAILAANKGLNVCLIEANEFLGGQPKTLYSQKEIYDFPGFAKIKGQELIEKLQDQLSDSKVKIYINVKTLSGSAKKDGSFEIILSNNETIACKYIILATGGGVLKPNKLDSNLEKESNNIHYTFNKLTTYKNKKIIILGGGDSAVDWANELCDQKITNDVSIIHRRPEFRALGESVSRLNTNNIKVFLNMKILDITSKEVVFSSNENEESKTLPFDFIIVQYGNSVDLKANNFLNLFKLNKYNRIEVTSNMSTGVDNVYAVGNLCAYTSKPNLIIAGMGEIAVATNDILLKNRKYE